MCVFGLLVLYSWGGWSMVGFVGMCGFLLVFLCYGVVDWCVGCSVWWFCCLVLKLDVECCGL